jgi:hypothetical protein
VEGAERDPAVALRQHGRLALDHGDDADAGEPPFVPGDQHDLATSGLESAHGLVHGRVGLGRGKVERKCHPGQDDRVLERDERQRGTHG